ncbi:MAG: serine/threonine protein kinase [Chromatiales bacterium]|nr:serine/threonine protein kinase [Chromatiales bacterium]
MEIPGYRIERQIGLGAMATVYLAIHEMLAREVALKVMSPSLNSDPTFFKRFLKEGRIIACLSHPNIIAVHDINSHDGLHYMALQYARGGHLGDRIRKGMTPTDALAILVQIGDALGFAHSQGFVHRDVKPTNILFREDDRPLLTDFGIAKAVNNNGNTEMTRMGSVIGTPRYMSPEQALGQTVSSRSDLYSLGVLFYEMLTGKRPYDNDTPIAIAMMHVNEPVPHLPDELARYQPIIDRLMAKQPADRFTDANAMLRAVQEIEGMSSDTLATRYGGSQTPPSGIDVAEVTVQLGTAPEHSPGAACTSKAENKRPLIATVGALLLCLIGAVGYWAWSERAISNPAPALDAAAIRDAQDYVDIQLRHLDDVVLASKSLQELEPKNADATSSLKESADEYASLARWAWVNVGKNLATQVTDRGLSAFPGDTNLAEIKTSLVKKRADGRLSTEERRQLERWLVEGEGHLAAGRFILPVGDNAVESYRKILTLDPNNEIAQRRLNELASAFEKRAAQALATGDRSRAKLFVRQGLSIYPRHQTLRELDSELTSTTGG